MRISHKKIKDLISRKCTACSGSGLMLLRPTKRLKFKGVVAHNSNIGLDLEGPL